MTLISLGSNRCNADSKFNNQNAWAVEMRVPFLLSNYFVPMIETYLMKRFDE